MPLYSNPDAPRRTQISRHVATICQEAIAGGISRDDLATRLGITPEYLRSHVLRGRANLTIRTIAQIERALGVELFAVPVASHEIETL